ncbi:trk system potassium uptake protein TrkH [Thermanaeromonas toyohensis ToBE]|uniref:Trk system potassium uptake protein TrkH n=1 Tax=Thermanaeromonas toyohensis ToBE TaxID=698762 RepID=A0A1W1W0C8_9FIRM|nr:TrkH family potassium uptake protein [Thermanaeromonas toyohensis]SMB98963.1 trk system potassium uptake protein TrkH [Thermanaeromonas toyohensis ToBE]
MLRLNPTQVVVLGFAGLILTGALFLMLPISSASGIWTDFLTALFTATSAVCVTGLVVVDTGTYWSSFGQMIILLLIQIGGLGWMSVATFLALVVRKRISLRERLLLQEALNRETLGGVVDLARRVIFITAIIESLGILILAARFTLDFGWKKGLYYGLFHAISAFNNAGFDVLGKEFGEFTSLTHYVGDPVVSLTVATLLVLGGLGFPVLMDVVRTKKLSRLSLHSKLVLLTTASLIIVGTALILIVEWDNPRTLHPLTLPVKILAAYFQAVTPRTAGFNTIDIAGLEPATQYLQVILMFIGASPAGTGGGIKTVTFAVLVLAVVTIVRGRQEVDFGGRQISWFRVFKALSIAAISFALVNAVTFILLITEGKGFLPVLYEVTSAFGTVGLSTGITPELSPIGRWLIIFTMFAGRVGPLSLAMAIWHKQAKVNVHLPEEQVILG